MTQIPSMVSAVWSSIVAILILAVALMTATTSPLPMVMLLFAGLVVVSAGRALYDWVRYFEQLVEALGRAGLHPKASVQAEADVHS